MELLGSTAGAGFWTAYVIVVLAIYIFSSIGLMGVFRKANQEPPWAAFIPFWNTWLIIKLTGRPTWYIWIFVGGAILGIIPVIDFITGIVTIVFGVFLFNSLSKSFGKGPGFTVGLILLFPVFIWILFKGPATYLGPSYPAAGGYPQGGYPPQGGGYPQQPGGYPQQPGGYPQQPGGYPQQPGGYPQQPGGYPQQGYPQQPPQPGGYPPPTGADPNQPPAGPPPSQ